MTGYQSKKAAARDKLAHMTFEQRCRVSEQCLPEAPYRAMLVALHDEMLEALAQPEQEPIVGTKTWFEDGKVVTQHLTAKDIYKEPEQEPWPEEPFGHMAGGVQPPQRPWVGLTAEQAAECWTTSATQTWKNFEAKLKANNT